MLGSFSFSKIFQQTLQYAEFILYKKNGEYTLQSSLIVSMKGKQLFSGVCCCLNKNYYESTMKYYEKVLGWFVKTPTH